MHTRALGGSEGDGVARAQGQPRTTAVRSRELSTPEWRSELDAAIKRHLPGRVSRSSIVERAAARVHSRILVVTRVRSC